MSNNTTPNFTMIPNYVFDKILPELSPAQGKVYLIIIRNTTGWNRATTKINQTQLAELANISRQTVKTCTEYLVKRNLVEVFGNKKIGLSYSFKMEIKAYDFGWKTVDQMLKNLTSEKEIQMLKILTSDVKNFNIPYILNTTLNKYIKKYIKKNTPKSAPKKQKKKVIKKSDIDLSTKEIFEEFKNKFEFINFEDYKRLIKKLEELNGSVSKKRVTQNLFKYQANKGRSTSIAFTSEQFTLSVDAFCGQEKYQGVWVVDVKSSKNNAVEDLPKTKSKNTMTDAELDAAIAGKVA